MNEVIPQKISERTSDERDTIEVRENIWGPTRHQVRKKRANPKGVQIGHG